MTDFDQRRTQAGLTHSQVQVNPYTGPIILLGASTGGVEALERVLVAFPKEAPPIVITQHMPQSFLRSLAARFDNRFAPDVALARHGESLKPGLVRIAPSDGGHLRITGSGPYSCSIEPGDLISGHRPSVDALFRSAIPSARKVCAALLTGMGRDGADGLLGLFQAGAFTIAQDRETSIVHGMPGAAIGLGAAKKVLPIDGIGAALLKQARGIGVLR